MIEDYLSVMYEPGTAFKLDGAGGIVIGVGSVMVMAVAPQLALIVRRVSDMPAASKEAFGAALQAWTSTFTWLLSMFGTFQA